MDVVCPLALVVEEALDDHSQGAIAQADVKQFYDHIQPLKIYRWLSNIGSRSVGLSFLRLQFRKSTSTSGAPAFPYRGEAVASLRAAGQLGQPAGYH